jgi:riboflavin kinase/FMN adenylyltransferase
LSLLQVSTEKVPGRVKLIRQLDDMTSDIRGGAVTIGNFDGVHHGHARIIKRLIDYAAASHGPAVVFTFDPHPVRLLRPALAPPPLTWTDRKAELLSELGVDALIAYPTDESLLALSPHDFFTKIIIGALDARAMVEGPNFFFGRDRAGDIHLLQELCAQSSLDIEIVQPVEQDERFISSSRIRDLIAAGDVEQARSMLTRPYRIRGMVTHGARRGASLGFPTANLDAVDTLVPNIGVYAGIARSDGELWPAAINIGPNPTFGEQSVKLEVHLVGFDSSLYGQPLEVDFLARLRDIHSFDSVEQLRTQLHRDVESAVECFRRYTKER